MGVEITDAQREAARIAYTVWVLSDRPPFAPLCVPSSDEPEGDVWDEVERIAGRASVGKELSGDDVDFLMSLQSRVAPNPVGDAEPVAWSVRDDDDLCGLYRTEDGALEAKAITGGAVVPLYALPVSSQDAGAASDWDGDPQFECPTCHDRSGVDLDAIGHMLASVGLNDSRPVVERVRDLAEKVKALGPDTTFPDFVGDDCFRCGGSGDEPGEDGKPQSSNGKCGSCDGSGSEHNARERTIVTAMAIGGRAYGNHYVSVPTGLLGAVMSQMTYSQNVAVGLDPGGLTAEHERTSLVDLVLPAEGERRTELIRLAGDALASDHLEHENDDPTSWDREAEIVFDALRAAAGKAGSDDA